MDENTYGIRKIGPQRYREDPGRYFEDFQVGMFMNIGQAEL